MDGLLVIDEAVFSELMSKLETNGSGSIDAIFKERVDNKLQAIWKCECFTTQAESHNKIPQPIIPTKNSFKSYAKKQRHHHNHHNMNHNNAPHRSNNATNIVRTASKYVHGISPAHRTVMGLLNKVNAINFNTIFNQLVRIPNITIKELTELVLDKATNDKTYLFVLCRCLKELRERDQESVDQILNSFSDSFHNRLEDDVLFFSKNTINDNLSYDDLCKFIKKKNYFIQKTLVLAKLAQMHVLKKISIEDLYKTLKATLLKNVHCEGVADVIVQIIADIHAMDINSHAAHFIQEDLHENFEYKDLLSNKTRFKILSMTEKVI